MTYKLVVVDAATPVDGAVASIELPEGTSSINAVVFWRVTDGVNFEGGSTSLRISLDREGR